MFPESRKDQLISQDVGQELVLYDQQTHIAHSLNGTAALVWRLADGKRTVAEISKILHDTSGTPDDEELVRLALSELDNSGLLLSGLPSIDANEPMTRRRLLSLSAALVPVVASIGIPNAASAQSYYSAPTIASVTPSRGPASGGTSVVITGSKLAATPVAVSVGGSNAPSFSLAGGSIIATTPAGTPGAKDVVVATTIGNATLSNGFIYCVLTSVTPATGAAAGGTAVTIAGVGLTGSTKVTFGGIDAATFTVVNDNSITATTPAGTSGAADVVVTLAEGEPVTLTDGFTYAAPAAETFTYNGSDDTSVAPSDQSYLVPTGVSSVVVEAFGAEAAGGGGGGGTGGLGGQIESTIAVTPGETLTIRVGGAPPTDATALGGFGGGGNSTGDAGGGGGASAVLRGGGGGTVLVIAAGGGGGGSNGGGAGGAGGGTTGGDGVTSGANGGGGGTPAAGGAAGAGSGFLPASAGSSLDGGLGGGGVSGFGGGGGGGYYGGGGGGGTNGAVGGGGGGGGSSFSSGASTTTTSGVRSGHGEITITPV